MKKNNFPKLLLLVAFFALISASCTSTDLDFGIIFSAELDGNQDIYRLYGPDFGITERLTFTPIDPEWDLTPTKDGQQIIFHVPAPSKERIEAEALTPPNTYPHTYLLNIKTNEVIDVGTKLNLYTNYPLAWSWNEDSFFIAETTGPGSEKIFLVDFATMSLREFKFPRKYRGSEISIINYSYDGKQIAYEDWHPFGGTPPDPTIHSYIYDNETQDVVLLSDQSIICQRPMWSPTRKQILLYCNLSDDGITVEPQIRILDVEESNIHIRRTFEGCLKPVWSPDGKQIAMVCRDVEKNTGIFLANYDGTNYREILANIPYYTPYLLWSPDGKQLIYSGADSTTELRHIYIVDIDGTNNRVITQEDANYTNLFVYPIKP